MLAGTDLDDQFFDFHLDHPEVYDVLVRLAREAVNRGKKRIGMKMIWEVARWTIWLETADPDFKLNNNYHSRYARLIMNLESDLNGVFEIRKLRKNRDRSED